MIAVTCLDPGLSNCTTHMVLVNINGDEVENLNPTQQLGEWMEFFELEITLVYLRVTKPWLTNPGAFNELHSVIYFVVNNLVSKT